MAQFLVFSLPLNAGIGIPGLEEYECQPQVACGDASKACWG